MNLKLAVLSVFLLPILARAYPVAPALPLDGLVKEADVIIKGTVVSSEKAADDSFKVYPHWAVFSTRLKIVSVLKGDVAEKEVDFHHYDEDPTANQGYMFAPQHYHFDVGENYIVFAKATKKAGTLRMVWDYHRGREDQGVMGAVDNKVIAPGTSVADAVWNELAGLAASDKPALLQYAIAHLHSMSNSADRFDDTNDFSREKVLAIIAPLIGHKEPAVAMAAIDAVGARSPYLRDDFAMGWLATVGKGTLLARGHSKYPDKWDNPDARDQMGRLVEVANKGTTAPLRARAIRALGLVRDRSLRVAMSNWLGDPSAEVRAAAAILWSDFPGDEERAQLTRLSADPDAAVRRAVATAIGFGQSPKSLSLLNQLLKDPDESVRSAAGTSLISFDPKDSGELLKAFRNDPDYRATFINAMALADAKPWLDDLAQIVSSNAEPKLYLVSQMPVYTSWQILKTEMDTRPDKELASGSLDKYLDALDLPPNIGSGPYQEMYQFYKDKGLKERAARFRAESKKRVTGYDIDYYFKRVAGVK